MSDTLAQLIDKVQIILGDSAGTYFSDATVTAALRQTLSDWNLRVPIFAATTITGVADQYEYELTDADTDSCEIYDVLIRGTDTAQDESKSVPYDDYMEDERLFFRLREPVTTSDTLIVRYTTYHTISGLDSAVSSTLPAKYDQAMVNGGAFYSIAIRAVSRIETINLSQDQSDNYREMAGGFAAGFTSRLAYAAKARKPARGEPDDHTWDDKYHGWDQ